MQIELYRPDGIDCTVRTVYVHRTIRKTPDMLEKPSTKDTILDAAEAVVAREGAGRLTIDAVAAESGVSKGGVLYHYPNQLALLQAMIGRMVDSVRAGIASAEARAKAQGEPVLPFVIAVLFERLKQEDPLANAVLAASAAQPELLDAAGAAIGEEFQRLVDAAPDPVLAQILFLSLDGLKLSQLLGLSHIRNHELDQVEHRMISLAREMYA